MSAPHQQPDVEQDSGVEETPEAAPETEVPAGEPEAPVTPTTPAPAEEPEELEQKLEELAAKAQKADEYLELAQRTKADFENYRKRAARETAVAQERGVAKMAKELLPAVDSLDRALAASDSENGNLA